MKAAFHTTGCKVNQYETEALAAMFAERALKLSAKGIELMYIL